MIWYVVLDFCDGAIKEEVRVCRKINSLEPNLVWLDVAITNYGPPMVDMLDGCGVSGG